MAEPRYSLRESSKLTSRYRDYIGEQSAAIQGHSNVQENSPQTSKRTTLRTLTPRKQAQQREAIGPKQQMMPAQEIQQIVVGTTGTEQQQEYDLPIGAEQEIRHTAGVKYEENATTKNAPVSRPMYGGSRYAAYSHQQQPMMPHDRRFFSGADMLSDELKSNLRKLKNVLKLPKARRFVFCEFFYSGVDQQIFLAENEFSQLMHEYFPNLKCRKLRKPEWREIRRLIGKPRRCSQTFLDEERTAVEEKRQKIRAIYNGSCTTMTEEMMDLPANLPQPPVVGQKIYARVRSPKDGIYAAVIDAVTDDGYRVVFDDANIPPCVIKDYEVMFDQPSELMSINYFLEQNRALARNSSKSGLQEIIAIAPSSYASIQHDKALTTTGMPAGAEKPDGTAKKITIAKDEKVGNFPVRMLVILVKLCKVIEYKKNLIGQLTMMNDCAEKMNMLDNEYPQVFKIQFSQLVLDLETINRLFANYLSALQVHYNTLLPHLNEPLPTDRPELLRKTCNTHAFQIVKHCNNELNVRDKGILHLITSLTSILLQLRTIGIHNRKFTIADTNILSESLKQIRSQIAPNNAAAFQDYVEVHIKQMLRMMTSK